MTEATHWTRTKHTGHAGQNRKKFKLVNKIEFTSGWYVLIVVFAQFLKPFGLLIASGKL